jgi:hypothetical protein
MGGMPGEVSKGRFCEALDSMLNATDAGIFVNRVSLLNDLGSNSQRLSQIFRTYAKTSLTEADYAHLDNEWFVGPARWWHDEDTDSIVRRGLENAIKQAGTLPIDTLWLCPGTHVAVSVCKSAQQVTLMLMTPPVPEAWLRLNEQRKWVGEGKVWLTFAARHARKDKDDPKSPFRAGLKRIAGDEELTTIEVMVEDGK